MSTPPRPAMRPRNPTSPDSLTRLTAVLHELDDGPKVNLDILRREALRL